jgi:hypothetical protein
VKRYPCPLFLADIVDASRSEIITVTQAPAATANMGPNTPLRWDWFCRSAVYRSNEDVVAAAEDPLDSV